MATMEPNRVDENSWWMFENDMIVCGGCLNDFLRNTEVGEYAGDEAVTLDMVTQLKDENEPVQCDHCGIQNEAYEEED